MTNLTLPALTDSEILAAVADLKVEIDMSAYKNACDCTDKTWLFKLPLLRVKPLQEFKVASGFRAG